MFAETHETGVFTTRGCSLQRSASQAIIKSLGIKVKVDNELKMRYDSLRSEKGGSIMSNKSVYSKIVELYKEHGSINKVVELLGGSASKIKVQRVLITEGLWSSKTSREIGDLFEKGRTPQEIADELKISLKNVQSYLPYTKGAYFENETSDAKASREYKQRNRHAARVQVRHVIPKATEAPEQKMFSPPRKMYQLHLELLCDLNEHEKEILRRFGKVRNSISRDIVVPPNITLHALHYAIQRAFGWQNSHLHHFSLDPSYEYKTVTELTGDTFANWGKLCGRYFRFPVDVNDDDEMDDVYWDEDYDEGMSHKVWLRKKYTGPYYYGGIGEHYLAAHTKYNYAVTANPIVRVSPSFQEYLANKGKQNLERTKPIGTLTIEEANRFFESGICELLERLRLDEVLSVGADTLETVYVPAVEEADEDQYAYIMNQYRIMEKKSQRYHALLANSVRRLSKADKELIEGPDPAIEVRKLRNGLIRLLNRTDDTMQPITDTLYYAYDYGDNWQVAITCTDVFTLKDGWTRSEEAGNELITGPITDKQFFESYTVTDQIGNSVEGIRRDQIVKARMKKTVKCLAADGLNLVDDVGGIHSFCEFLNEIRNGNAEEKDRNLEWAESMGWSNKMPRFENLL